VRGPVKRQTPGASRPRGEPVTVLSDGVAKMGKSRKSVMSITEIASRAQRRERIVGTHFWNPPYLIPLVEVVRAADTDEATLERTLSLLRSVGKHAVRVEKDVPGFVANRLQHALWREAISIVERGIADAETVGESVRGRRERARISAAPNE